MWLGQDIKLRVNPGYLKELKGNPNWYLYINIHSYYELFTIAKRCETSQVSIKRWLDKQNVAYILHTSIIQFQSYEPPTHACMLSRVWLFSNLQPRQAPLSRGFNSKTCYNMANLKTFCYIEGAMQKRTITLILFGMIKRFGKMVW